MEFGGLIDASLIDSVVRSLIPILLAALGGLICERAGIFNIALEGMMLVGAFFAVAASYWSGSALVGVLTAAVASAVFSPVKVASASGQGFEAPISSMALNFWPISFSP